MTVPFPPEAAIRADGLETVARAAALLLENGQTTELTVAAAERLGRALGLPVTVHPRWGELAVQVDNTASTHIVRATPLGVDTGKVMAVMTVVDQVCDGTLPADEAAAALARAAQQPPIATLRLALFTALGAAALGVIFGVADIASLALIALSAGGGALLRRCLAQWARSPFLQPLCAAFVAGLVGALAVRLNLADAQGLIALCPCLVLVPGAHILNGTIDLVRTRIALGAARLTYAWMIVVMISAGLLVGLAAGGASLPAGGGAARVPLVVDVIAAGCAVAAFGTFFAIPWRLMAIPIAIGMAAHAVRSVLVTVAGAHVATAALVACVLAGIAVAPLARRAHLPFAPLAFAAIVAMIPGVHLFRTAAALVSVVALGADAPVELLASLVANGTLAFLIILAMTMGLVVPPMLVERLLPPPRDRSQG